MSGAVDPHIGGSDAVCAVVYPNEPLRVLPGAQLGMDLPIVDGRFIALVLHADAWTYLGSDFSVVPARRMRVGWTFWTGSMAKRAPGIEACGFRLAEPAD